MALFLAAIISNEDKEKLNVPLLYLKQHSECPQYEDSSAFHITIRKVCDDDSHYDKVIDILKAWEKEYVHKPFEVKIKNFYHFPGHKEGTNIEWMGVHSSFPLYNMKYQIETVANEYAKYDIAYNVFEEERFDYNPHVTVGFDLVEHEDFNKNFEPIPIVIRNIVLWGYDTKIRNVHLADILYNINL